MSREIKPIDRKLGIKIANISVSYQIPIQLTYKEVGDAREILTFDDTPTTLKNVISRNKLGIAILPNSPMWDVISNRYPKGIVKTDIY